MAERPEDLNLPTAVISRIIKDALPDGVAVSKDARLAISKAASVFVLYATSCSNNFALKSKRKTISGLDVLSAMKDMEFEKFQGPLRESLEAFKKDQKGRKEATAAKKASAEQEKLNTSGETEAEAISIEEESRSSGQPVQDAEEESGVEVIEDDSEGEAEEGSASGGDDVDDDDDV